MKTLSKIELPLFLNRADCEAAGALDYASAIETCERVLKAREQGSVNLPGRIHLRVDKSGGRMFVAPMHIESEPRVLGLLWMTVFTGKISSDLGGAFGFYALHDCDNGRPLAIIDCGHFDRMATSAINAVAVKHLARRTTKTLAIVGGGRIGRGLAVALNIVIEGLSEIRVHDIDPRVAESAIKEISPQVNARARTCESMAEATRGADVVASCTTSKSPILTRSMLEDVSFYSQIGASPEASPDVVGDFDKIVVLDWAENKRQGSSTLARMCLDGKFDEKGIYGDLGEIVSGKKAGRTSEEECIYFSPLGTAGTSIVLAYHVYRRAVDMGIGQPLKL